MPFMSSGSFQHADGSVRSMEDVLREHIGAGLIARATERFGPSVVAKALQTIEEEWVRAMHQEHSQDLDSDGLHVLAVQRLHECNDLCSSPDHVHVFNTSVFVHPDRDLRVKPVDDDEIKEMLDMFVNRMGVGEIGHFKAVPYNMSKEYPEIIEEMNGELQMAMQYATGVMVWVKVLPEQSFITFVPRGFIARKRQSRPRRP